MGAVMGIGKELESIRRRTNRLAAYEAPPDIKIHVIQEGQKPPLIEDEAWALVITIENKCDYYGDGESFDSKPD